MNDVVWHTTSMSKRDRQEMNGHQSFAIWLTGLSGAGKSTVADALELELCNRKVRTYLLDGDNLRLGINSNLGFSDEDRSENIRRVSEVAKLFVDAGLVVITAVISPRTADRMKAKERFDECEFFEVFVDCPMDVCQKRDPKGLYKKALSGEILNFTGIGSAYEAPSQPDVIVRTDKQSVQDCVNEIIAYFISVGVLV